MTQEDLRIRIECVKLASDAKRAGSFGYTEKELSLLDMARNIYDFVTGCDQEDKNKQS